MRRLPSLVHATLLASLVACAADIESGIESADDLMYAKQYHDAERLYRKLLKRLDSEGRLDEDEDKQRLHVLDRLGKLNDLYLRDYNQALADYRRLTKLYPKTDSAFAARTAVADIQRHKLADLPAAIEEYQQLLAEFPERPEARAAQLHIANAYVQLRNHEQARTEAEVVLNRWPNSAEAEQARFLVANSFYLQGRYAEAIATYERLLEGSPDDQLAALVLFELGNCLQELGEGERALAYYYACLKDHPNPTLVQRKVQRLRARLDKSKPVGGIHLPEYVTKRLAVAQVPEAKPRRKVGGESTAEAADDTHREHEAPEEPVAPPAPDDPVPDGGAEATP